MRLLIADDHELLRDALTSLLRQESDLDVVTAADVEEALDVIARSQPLDLVVLDYAMPGMNGLEGLSRFLQAENAPPVALLSGIAAPSVVQQALKMGARGFLHKSMPAKSLLNALRFMAKGEKYVAIDFLEQTATPAPTQGAIDLTRREKEVLAALCDGKTNKEVARDLGLSEPTIKLHVKTLYRRLGVNNRTQAAMVARSLGLA